MFQRQSSTQEILQYLAVGSGVIVLSLFAPQLPYQLLKRYIKVKQFERWKFLQDLRRLQSRKLIRYQLLPSGEVKMVLRKEGKSILQRMTIQGNVDKVKIRKPGKWDKKWRLVIFDIPREKNRLRDILREKMKRMGFYQLQKSVFIHPYPCETEIELIANYYHIRDHILLLIVSDFEGQEKLMRSVFQVKE